MNNTDSLAVLAAATSGFALGGLWYSRFLFGKIWMQENGSSEKSGHPVRVFVFSFLFALIMATAFTHWIGPKPGLEKAVAGALIAGVGIVASCFGINYQFAERSLKLWLIDAGYHVVQLVIFALIFGLWPAPGGR